MASENSSNDILGTEINPTYIPTEDERSMAMLVHVLSIFFWILPGLIIYLLKKDESSFVAAHAKEAMNFQLTLTIMYIVLLISLVGIILLWVPYFIQLALCIVATMKASDRKLYKYPFTIRLIK
ncbi:MAG: DUF4870 domain-containing protein [Chitinophagaceae bacterium]